MEMLKKNTNKQEKYGNLFRYKYRWNHSYNRRFPDVCVQRLSCLILYAKTYKQVEEYYNKNNVWS